MQDSFFSDAEMSAMSSGLCPPAPKDYVLPTSFPDLRNAARICVDLETCDPDIYEKGPGVRRSDSYVVGTAISARDRDGKIFHAEYYPQRHRQGPNCDDDKVWQYLRDQLNGYTGELTGANVCLYDGDWLQSHGVRPEKAKWRDIQWAEAILDETALNYKLETIAQKRLGTGKITNHFALDYGPDYIKRFQEVHPGHARAYGLGDVLLPHDILDQQLVELESLGMMELYDMESRLTPFLLYLRRQGVRIGLDKTLGFEEHLIRKREEKLREASRLCGVTLNVENFGKTGVLSHVFQKLGIKVPLTAKKEPSFKDTWFHGLCDCKRFDEKEGKDVDNYHCGHFGRALEMANKYDKSLETFVKGYVLDHHINSRVYGEFHPLRRVDDDMKGGAVSGRFSSSHPNLQNIPARDEELGPLCRSMFVPEEGAEWWSLDYSQIEYRFLVHFAVANKCKGAKDAQRMYEQNPKTDFHEAVAELTGLKRKDAKNLNFGLVYGMGKDKLAASLKLVGPDGKPLPEAIKIMDTYHGKAPFIKALYELQGKLANETGETRTILNRRGQFNTYEPRYTPKDPKTGKMQRVKALPLMEAHEAWGFDVKPSMTHKALNKLLQGSAADMMKVAMVKCWEAGVFTSTTDFTCSLTVHDELDGSIFPTARGNEAYQETRNILCNAIPLNVPVLVGEGRGSDWSEAK